MSQKRVKIQHLLESQLPSYVRDEFPLIDEFFSQYYAGLEYQGGTVDLINNIDSYIKLNSNANNINETLLASDVTDDQDFIDVYSTEGFPDFFGIIQVNDEIIVYQTKTDTRFLFCTRGFLGVTSYETKNNSEEAVFSDTEASTHTFRDPVKNLSVLFLEEFLKKVKNQFLPGLQTKNLSNDLNEAQFVRQSRDLYSTRGTESSFKILFKALYNEEIDLIRPQDFLISPSNASFQLTRDLIVEPVEGDPENLVNTTLFQDAYENITKAYAPISYVQKTSVGILTDTYYKISIDASPLSFDGSSELLYGEFSIHAKTRVIDNVSVGQTYIDVDSTIGFPKSGTLSITYNDGTSGIITYTNTSTTQFLGVTTTSVTQQILDKSEVDQNTFAYGYDPITGTSDGIKVKIRSVLNSLDAPESSYYQLPDSKIKIKSLGKISSDLKSSNWFLNTTQYCLVESLSLEDSINNIYRLTTKDDNIFRIGDRVSLTNTSLVVTSNFSVTDVISDKIVLVRGPKIDDLDKITRVTKRKSKFDSDAYSELSQFDANIQNTYVDGEKVLIASNSLPAFLNLKTNPKNQKFTINDTFSLGQETITLTTNLDHNFFTGDVVYYTPEKTTEEFEQPDGSIITIETIKSFLFTEGKYIVKRIDDNKIKLAKSVSNLYAGKFESVTPTGGVNTVDVINNTIERNEFRNKSIKAQKIYREIAPPIIDSVNHKNNLKYSGVLINGVEILNYKSKDKVHYGELRSINVDSGGTDYDVINPPLLHISDSVGTGATGLCAIEGTLKQINVLDPGFDYTEVPLVKITGGNGNGATADANLITVSHQVSISPTGLSTVATGIGSVGFGSTGSTIGFSTFHKFRNGERVVYKTFGEKAISGLSTDAVYHVSVKTRHLVSLHPTLGDSLSGINTVIFNSAGEGVHQLKSLIGKSVLGSISVTNSGQGYENKQRICGPSGISTALNIITIPSHEYKTGEIIQYSVDGTAASGLSTTLDYYVTELNKDQFKLSPVGLGTTSKDFYLKTNQYQEILTIGVGTHSFNYPPISVEVIGKVGIASTTGSDFKAIVQPIFRGHVTSVQLTDVGVGYGVSEVINFKRDPEVKLNSGEGAQLEAVISDTGKITDVIINRPGEKYNSPPALVVSGIGSGADLIPKLSNGTIVDVIVNRSGVGYGASTTTIKVVASGSDAKFTSNLQTWNINNVVKNESSINNDDTFISDNESRELQIAYGYAPRTLRSTVYGVDNDGKRVYGEKDLQLSDSQEIDSTFHSGIIGWAYDGHPIYGPYAYASQRGLPGGNIVQMKSGYVLDLKPNRPPVSSFPQEFFVEDFTWVESTSEETLDRNNGRFCITPDFPNGTYAYFATVDTTTDSDGVFKSYKRPVFPYLIGDSFQGKPNEFNYNINSTQDNYDITSNNWRRNTYPYALNKNNSGYDYLQQSYNFVDQDSTIKTTLNGNIESIGIMTGGFEYRVNDRVVFDKDLKTEFFAAAKVSKVGGVGVNSISIGSTNISNVEFYPTEGYGAFIGISSIVHNLDSGDIVTISGISTTTSFLEGNYKIGVNTNFLKVSRQIGTDGATGIITYLSVSGGDLVYPEIQENDILSIGTGGSQENVKVLNIDRISSRLRILRAQNGVTGVSHSITTVIAEQSRRFTADVGYKTSFTARRNREYYFDPSESLGISTVTGTGVGKTISFSNPGSGVTSKFVLSQHLYLPNHGLITGDQVTYKVNGGDAISISTVSAGPTGSLIDNSKLFVTNLGVDFIGLSSIRVGLGTTGTFVGIGSTTDQGLFFFVGVGTGVNHSLVTDHKNVIKADIDRKLVTVSTSATHGLSRSDVVFVDVNPAISTTRTVRYNQDNRKLVIDSIGFTTAGVGTTSNTITLSDHGLVTGQKVIHSSSSPSGGLSDNKEYYAYVIDVNNIRLCDTKYETTKATPTFVNITSSSNGDFLPVNPPLTFYRNSTVTFDTSDSSLSFERDASTRPAFSFKFYTDSDFTKEYLTTSKTGAFAIDPGGVGLKLGTSGSTITLIVDENTPKKLYYKLIPLNVSGNPGTNLEAVISDDVDSHNEIIIKDSLYDGTHVISGVTTNSFSYNVDETPEESRYVSSASTKLSYTTSSKTAYGPIAELDISDTRKGYSKLPGISTITSSIGRGAVLKPASTSIGKIVKTKLNNIGFDYPADHTLSPEVNFPQILEVTSFYKFTNIGITSFGQGYKVAPTLIVLDGNTNQKLNDIDIRYSVGDTEVEILKNTLNLSDTNPVILPVNNPNGIRVSNLEYNSVAKTVTATLKEIYSENFPLVVGDKILVENSVVGIDSTASVTATTKGLNSDEHNYQLFTVTATTERLGGNVGIVTYSFDVLESGEVIGTFDAEKSATILTPQKYFPVFDYKLESNTFQTGNIVKSGDSEGTIFDWDGTNQIISIESSDDFLVGDTIVEDVTGSKAVVNKRYAFSGEYDLNYFSLFDNGWREDNGILNKLDQKIADNDYYQNFSYSIKSKVPFESWNDIVSSLLHSAGFKKFSDLQVESQVVAADEEALIPNPISATTIEIDLISEVDLECTNNYDLATENFLGSATARFSDEISLKTRIISDFSESITNRVLTIDDISYLFNSNARSTPFQEVARHPLAGGVAQKFVILAKDRKFTAERQMSLVTVLNDVHTGKSFINQYGDVDTVLDLGNFDYTIDGSDGVLQFFPTKFTINNYNLSLFSYNLDRLGLNTSSIGIGTTTIGISTDASGSLISIASTNHVISGLTTTNVFTLAGIGTTTSGTRAAKILFSIENSDNQAEFDELSIVAIGTHIESLEYGQLTTHSIDAFGGTGLGTYGASLSGSDIIVKYTPNSGVTTTYVNALSIGISSESYVGVGTQGYTHGNLIAQGVGIASSSSPSAVQIGHYGRSTATGVDGAYGILMVSDTTNNITQMSEFVIADDDTDIYLTEYGVVDSEGGTSASGLGTLGATRASSETRLNFTPNADIDVHVKTFINALSVDELRTEPGSKDLTCSELISEFSTYTGTLSSVKRDFELKHRTKEIFKRNFDGTDANVVNITDNTINLPDHFFVSGQELTYSTVLGIKTDFISIGSTDGFVGVGTTTTLPSSVFCIKVDNDTIKIATTAENALKKNPVSVAFTGVGIGNSHTFTAKDANQKVLLTIDNMIQSPIVGSSVTTTTIGSASATVDVIKFDDILRFAAGDYVEIDSEIVKVLAIGIGSTNNVKVTRAWLGTDLEDHSDGSLVTKLNGNYNIVGNTVNFAEAPNGNRPIGSTTDGPSFRDWTGITTSATFSGRSFVRTGIQGSSDETYTKNHIFDDISPSFDGQTKTFALTSGGSNVTGITTYPLILINGILQGRGSDSDFTATEQSGITSITFTGAASSVSYDVNNASIPTGGVIVSVASSEGFGYQPLVAAGGTAVISAGGTVSSISIGNSGSGYRVGVQTTINVGVGTSSLGSRNIEFIGTAAVENGHIVSVAITNPGSGYTATSAPFVVFDDPLSYHNIQLDYISGSSGVGTEARVDVVVGQGSSVIEFNLSNTGSGYSIGDVLTFAFGGNTGIPTESSVTFEEFKITIDEVDTDQFNAWSVGSMDVLDDISNLFDGERRTFPIKKDGDILSILSRPGSNITIQDNIFVFINDVLQQPDVGYKFAGGSVLELTEAPNVGDTFKFFYYKGTSGVDVVDVDVTETIKVGDELTLESTNIKLDQNERLVTQIVSSRTVNTNVYPGPGLSGNPSLERPVKWCRQRDDLLINGKVINKSRDLYEPKIFPSAYLIKSVGVGSTEVYVDNVRPSFNPLDESTDRSFQNTITIFDYTTEKVSAAATAVVSTAGTVSSIVISTGGVGYSTTPNVTIQNPVGLGTTARAEATATVSAGGTISGITISTPGVGYTNTNPPVVLIGPPASLDTEDNGILSYSGDFGIITGVGTDSVGVASTAIIFDLLIPALSPLRDNTDITPQTTTSGIATGDYFVVYQSTVGNGVTALDENSSVIGIGTTCLDNIYRVADVSIANTSAIGLGTTNVARVTVSISDFNGFSAAGLAISEFYGRYSWGKLVLSEREESVSYDAITSNGVVGIQTGPFILRKTPFKSSGFVT